MAAAMVGELEWSLTMDEKGHRDYKMIWLVESAYADGPASVLVASGLPAIGSTWTFGNDNDPWAFCWPDWKISPILTKEPNNWWTVEQTFSTKPLVRCQDNTIEDPLDEPPILEGSFVTYTREYLYDRHGNPLLNGAFQRLTGPDVEFDDFRPTVSCSFNIPTLPLSTFSDAMNCVNDDTLWGLSARKIKLSSVFWRRVLYGTCSYFYNIQYVFDIMFQGFDRTVPDYATRYLAPNGNPLNPTHYKTIRGVDGEPARLLLNSAGQPWNGTGSPNTITIEAYPEYDFMLLGIPASL